MDSSAPLMKSELGVPICSATIPNGTELSGIAPNVIMPMLIMRPRISGAARVCIIVMPSDICTELITPISSRNGTAAQYKVVWENAASPTPQITVQPISISPRRRDRPGSAASHSVPNSAPTPMMVIRIPSPSD